jgi:uncharacterized membrane protein YvbJ
MKKCPYCGTSVNEGDVFCTECGKRIDDVTETVSFEPIGNKKYIFKLKRNYK